MVIRKKVLVAGVIALIMGLGPRALASSKVVERIIARVNNEIVTQRQFAREQAKLREQLAQEYSGAELEAQVRLQSKNLLRDLIDQSLMVQKAKDLDLNVETELIKRLDQIRENMKLATLQDLEKEVEKQGLVWEDFQDQFRRQMLMQNVISREVGSRMIISREDARKYFEGHQKDFASPAGLHLSEILISTEKRKPEEAEKRAKDCLAELKGGAKWTDLVKKYSDDPTATEGGDVGFFKEGTLAPAIASALAKLDTGETTDLIQTKYGYQVFKVFERRSAGIPKFEEVEQRVDEALYEQKLQPALREYLANLRKESFIYLAPGYVDAGAVKPGEGEPAVAGAIGTVPEP